MKFDMGKSRYVNGNIFIKTRYFAPKDLGCGYKTPPEGSEFIEANVFVSGMKCLLIDDDHPQSLFNEYYAQEDVVSDSLTPSYLHVSFNECINEYGKRIGEICEVVRKVADWDDASRSLVYKMSYVSILTALDAFICYILLRRSVKDEKLFDDLMFELGTKSKCEKWRKLRREGQIGEWEQDAIRHVLETSFINTEKIDKCINKVGMERLDYDREKLGGLFRIRHLIVHRSGRQRDDNEVSVSFEQLRDLINECHTFVGAVYDSLWNTIAKELKDKPKERDLEEIFPGGLVLAPFKMSDLNRLLMSDEPDVPPEPIQLPTLSEECFVIEPLKAETS